MAFVTVLSGVSSGSLVSSSRREVFRRVRVPSPTRVRLVCHADVPSELSSTNEEDAVHISFELDSALEMLKDRKSTDMSPSASQGPGSVYLVGTGPGDPSLLTIRAVELMRSADVVLYDRLVSNDILRYVHGGARMIYVGKQSGFHTRSQDEIHELLLQFAESGKTILRLKGGDPYIFGRGGEEVEFLEKRGISVKCIPGITAASGIGAELGIPMTHRGIASSVRYITGHVREDGGDIEEVFDTVAVDEATTIVIYMGLANLPKLAKHLRSRGLDENTPAVAVERGTMPEQRVVFSELQDLQQRVEDEKLKSPTLLIIGQVVSLSRGWQERENATIKEETIRTTDISSTSNTAVPV